MPIKNNTWFATASTAALLAASLHAPAFAQDSTPAGSDVVLDTIVVQGQAEVTGAVTDGYITPADQPVGKGGTPLIENPQAVSIIAQDQMADQKPISVDQAVRYAPGVQAQPFGNDSRFDWFFIRGFEAYQDGVFMDGMSLFQTGFASWRVEPFTLDHIEVMRGPASILLGGSNPGGVLNLVSKLPTDDFQNRVEFGIDTDMQAFAALDTGRASEDGVWSFRVNGIVRGGDTATDLATSSRYTVAPSLTWKPTDQTTLTVFANLQHDETNSQNGFLPYVGTVVDASFGKIDPELFLSDPSVDAITRDQWMVGYKLETTLDSDITLRQNARLSGLSVNYTGLYANGYDTGTVAETDLNRVYFDTDPQSRLLTIDNQAEKKFDLGQTQHTLLTGVDYKLYTLNDDQAVVHWLTTTPGIDVLNPAYNITLPDPDNHYIQNSQTMHQLGVYAQDKIKIGERLTVMANGRYDFVSTEIDHDNPATADQSSNHGAFSGRIGAVYEFANGIAPYVSASTFFNPKVGAMASGELFEPVTGQQFEVGMRYVPSAWRGSFQVSAFHLTQQNSLTTDPASTFNSIQTGEVRSMGVELEGAAYVTDELKIIGSATIMDVENTKSTNLNNELGKTPTRIAEQTASLWADYTFQTGQLEGFGFGAGVRYVGPTWADAANTLEVPEVALLDAALHFDRGNFSAAVNATNVLDETYVASCQSSNACFYGEGRKVMLTLGYNW